VAKHVKTSKANQRHRSNGILEALIAEAKRLKEISKEIECSKVGESLSRLREAANDVAQSWSGSWLGYQSRVYYRDLAPAPAGAHFSAEWGFQDLSLGLDVGGTRGDWGEYTFEAVHGTIFSRAGVDSLKKAEDLSARSKSAFEHAREHFLSAIAISAGKNEDEFLTRLKDRVGKMVIGSKFDFVRALQPRGQFFSRDSLAISQGFQTPPHIAVLSEITALLEPSKKCAELATILERAATHLQLEKQYGQQRKSGTKVFLGHGRSPVWKDLKDFIQDRLDLPWDEFNRVPVAGITNIARLSATLDDASIAFLVLTAEDEQLDGTMRARENVVHEAGLFQGGLGFTKAIILLEEGCDEFSNIHGLGQIRFPKGNIKAVFEEVRLILEREGLTARS
jgi:predicted nucleotide-binding protein